VIMENRRLLTLDEGQILEKMKGVKANILQTIK